MLKSKWFRQLNSTIKNKFYNDVQELYTKCPTPEDLKTLLGRARAKRGMFEGDLVNGELEIGQIAGLIHDIKPAANIIEDMIAEFETAKQEVSNLMASSTVLKCHFEKF